MQAPAKMPQGQVGLAISASNRQAGVPGELPLCQLRARSPDSFLATVNARHIGAATVVFERRF